MSVPKPLCLQSPEMFTCKWVEKGCVLGCIFFQIIFQICGYSALIKTTGFRLKTLSLNLQSATYKTCNTGEVLTLGFSGSAAVPHGTAGEAIRPKAQGTRCSKVPTVTTSLCSKFNTMITLGFLICPPFEVH